MSAPIITIENLSKRYIIEHQRSKDDGIRHILEDAIRAPFKWLRNEDAQEKRRREEFWALKEVSFEIKQGEVVGIVGRNGAGKSTLLKILSRITEPTTGRICIDGRVASLLEVGTGFHQELTGRENVFLNGAILGMTRIEIKRKFDEIVAFAEVEKFLDTPVKRYSSGMYVRLAFAVAAHLEPEILIVDEVLAVGDTQFQAKCLGKMGEAARGGRTVLFVSHNMPAVKQLCSRAILLQSGKLHSDGDVSGVIDAYLHGIEYAQGTWVRKQPIPSTVGAFFTAIAVVDSIGRKTVLLSSTARFLVDMHLVVTADIPNLQLVIRFTNQDGIVAFSTCNTDHKKEYTVIKKGAHHFTVCFDAAFLPPGKYHLQFASHISRKVLYDLVDLSLTIEETGSLRTVCQDDRLGAVNPVFEWQEKWS